VQDLSQQNQLDHEEYNMRGSKTQIKPKHRQKKNSMTKKNNSAINKKKKPNLGLLGIGRKIIDHGPEYA
jgi:hypothetical protein